jgi:hypothetical protein
MTAGAVDVTGQAPRLRDQVNAHGADFHSEIRVQYPRVSLATLVAESELIVIGTIIEETPVLTDDFVQLHTNCTTRVEQVIGRRPALRLRQGDALVLRRPGGVTTIDGFNVVIAESDFPRLKMSEQHVLFLKSVPSASHFILSYGGQGAFRIEAGNVRQASLVFGDWTSRAVQSLSTDSSAK